MPVTESLPTADERLEWRLMHEATTINLGTLWHKNARCDGTDDCCQVEVTFGVYEDDELGAQLEQNAGYFIVHVPVYAPTGVESWDMDHHPATLASDCVHEHLEPREYDYLSIDDIRAY